MFEAIQKSIIIVRDHKIIFFNAPATRLFKLLCRHQIQQSSLIPDLSDESLIDDQLFHVYENLSFEETKGKITQDSFSIRQMLSLDREVLSNLVFTSSKKVAQCETLEMLKETIDVRRDSNDKPSFFQIKVRDLNIEGEVMVSIHDISLRILSQNLKSEAKYLSIMNSTTSHEMRNPLNSITSNIKS